MAKNSNKPAPYENNPFLIATKGLSLMFDLALGVAALFAVMSFFSFLSRYQQDENEATEWVETLGKEMSRWPIETWALAIAGTLVVLLAAMLISALISGVSSYTAVQLSKQRRVSITEAFRESFANLWSYLWLQLIISVKVLLWTLLFIVPGIIAATKYSLAGLAFFDDNKKLRGNAAVNESIRLTKGAWITTYGANAALNFVTLGAITSLITPAVNAVLYRQYDKMDDKKPAAHPLSWLALILPFIMFGILFIILTYLAIYAATGGTSPS